MESILPVGAPLFASTAASGHQAQPAPPADPNTIERQAYRIGAAQLVIRFEDASELATLPAIARLPGAPDGVRGLTNLHGNIIPVMDIAGWLGLTHDPHKPPMLLVCGYGEDAVGIIIDGLPDRKKFLPEQIQAADQTHSTLALFTRTRYRDPTGMWIELDERRLFREFTREVSH